MKKYDINYPLLIRRICLMILDSVCVVFASVMSLATRFEFDLRQIPREYSDVLFHFEIFFILITLAVFWLFKIYSSL